MSNNISHDKIESFVSRARISAKSGPYLLLGGIFLAVVGIIMQSAEVGAMVAMAVIALFTMHVAGTLWHQFTKSDMMARMGWRGWETKQSSS